MARAEEWARWARREAKLRARKSRMAKSGLTLKTVVLPTIKRKVGEVSVAAKRKDDKRKPFA